MLTPDDPEAGGGRSRARSAQSRTLPHPPLRRAALLSFFPALPLCITHGALSRDAVPAVGLVPLAFSAGVSLFLLLRGRSSGESVSGNRDGDGVSGGKGKGPERGGRFGEGGFRGEPEGLEEEAERSGIEPGSDEGGALGGGGHDGNGHDEGVGADGRRGDVLTHRILVFVVDTILAAALMVALVFTWTGTSKIGDKRPELAMLAAYATVPLLVNFIVHFYLAARELVAGLAIPSLVEYAAWRAVPPDCPHCGRRLRPDRLPPIPWYETVERPSVSFPRVSAPAIPRPSLPAFKLPLPKFSGFKGPREWRFPSWFRERGQEYAPLFADEDRERGGYTDDPEGPFGGPSRSTAVVATGAPDPAPVVEEVVVGKKDKRGKSNASQGLFGDDDVSWA